MTYAGKREKSLPLFLLVLITSYPIAVTDTQQGQERAGIRRMSAEYRSRYSRERQNRREENSTFPGNQNPSRASSSMKQKRAKHNSKYKVSSVLLLSLSLSLSLSPSSSMSLMRRRYLISRERQCHRSGHLFPSHPLFGFSSAFPSLTFR